MLIDLDKCKKIDEVCIYPVEELDKLDCFSLEYLFKARRVLKKDNTQYFYCYLHPTQFDDLLKDSMLDYPYMERNSMFNRVIGIVEDIIVIESNDIEIKENKSQCSYAIALMISNIGEYVEIFSAAYFFEKG